MSDQFNENNYSLKMDKSILSFNKDTMTLRTVSYTHLTLPTIPGV